MELRHLEAFLALSEFLNFSRASEKLFISQSALSKRIIEIEAELDIKLFDRNSHNVTLTEAGRDFLPRATAALAAFSNLTVEKQESRHTLRIGFTVNILDQTDVVQLYLGAEREFLERRPKLRTQPEITTLFKIRSDIMTNSLDMALAISHDLPKMEPVKTVVLYETPMCIVSTDRPAPPGRKSTPREISDFLNRQTIYQFSSQMRSAMHIYMILSDLGVNSSRVQYLDSMQLACLRVARGDGVLLLPKSLRNLLPCYSAGDAPLVYTDIPVSTARIYALLAWNGEDKYVTELAEDVRRRIESESPWEQWGQSGPFLN